jgi:membrane-bound lytic murein transglycosylase D
LRINRRVDERFNVQLATRAAARLLRENYAVLGTWPLAVTAYNHGTSGMQRAVKTVGTKDFGAIVTRYHGPLFGFASRNFYAEFLAAVEVVKHHKQHFPNLVLARSPYVQSDARQASQEASHLPTAAATSLHNKVYRVRPGDTLWAIARRFGTTTSQLVALNNLKQRRLLTPGQALRLPAGPPQEGIMASMLSPGHRGSVKHRAVSLPASAPTRGHMVARTYRVHPGDTLSAIARRHGTTVRQLVAVNGLKRRKIIKAGQRLVLPASPRYRTDRQVKAGRT